MPIQTPSEDEILVKVKAIAINPTDWKRSSFRIAMGGPFLNQYAPNTDAKWFTKDGSYVGSDFAGEVVQVGPKVKTNVKVGDRVASSVRGGVSRERGAFSEYAKTFADLALVIPEGTWSFEEASTIGIPYVARHQRCDPRRLTPMVSVCIPPSRFCTDREP